MRIRILKYGYIVDSGSVGYTLPISSEMKPFDLDRPRLVKRARAGAATTGRLGATFLRRHFVETGPARRPPADCGRRGDHYSVVTERDLRASCVRWFLRRPHSFSRGEMRSNLRGADDILFRQHFTVLQSPWVSSLTTPTDEEIGQLTGEQW